MSIAAGFAPLQAQIMAAFSMDIAGNPSLTASIISGGVATALATGLYQLRSPPKSPITPPPAGIPATQAQLIGAFSMDVASNPALFATMFAAAISVASPVVPPSGFAFLQAQVMAAMNLDIAGNPPLFATMVSSAVITYFTMGQVF